MSHLPVALALLACTALLLAALPKHPILAAGSPHKQLIDGFWQAEQYDLALQASAATQPRQREESPTSDDRYWGDVNIKPWQRLVYSEYNGDNWELGRLVIGEFVGSISYSNYLMTNSVGDDLGPRLSRDGSRVLFYSDRNGNHDLFVMPVEGAGLTQLTGNPAPDIQPIWSPDGAAIAFASKRDGNHNIYVMRADGTGLTRLTSAPEDDVAPTWSPDGRSIAWARIVGTTGTLMVMGSDGQNQRSITPAMRYLGNPSWSPDGTTIAFDHDANNDGLNVPALINADGTNQRDIDLTDTYGSLYDFSVRGWSGVGDRVFGSILSYREIDGSIVATGLYLASVFGGYSGSYPINDMPAPRMMPDVATLDQLPPVTDMAGLPEYRRAGEVRVAWSGADQGRAELHSYDVQIRIDNGTWTNWRTRLPANTTSAAYTGKPGTTVDFRMRGRDWGGNLEAYPEQPEATVRFFSGIIAGRITDTRGYAVPAAMATNPIPIDSPLTNGEGSYATRLTTNGPVTLNPQAAGYQSPGPITIDGVQDRLIDAVMLPSINVIRNGGFEASDLADWQIGGSTPPAASGEATFHGAGAVRFGNGCAPDVCFMQEDALPDDGGQVAIGPDGRQHFVGTGVSDGRWVGIYQSRMPGGAWSAKEVIPAVAQLVVAQDGTVHGFYEGFGNVSQHIVRRSDGTWTSPVPLGKAFSMPLPFVHPDGRLFLIYTCEPEGSCPDGALSALRIYDLTTGWSNPLPLHGYDVRGAMASDGTAYIFWRTLTDGWFMRTVTASGSLGSIRRIGPDNDTGSVLIQVDQRGIIYFIGYGPNHAAAICLPDQECAPIGPLEKFNPSPGIVNAELDSSGTLHVLNHYLSADPRESGAYYRQRLPGGTWTEPWRASASLHGMKLLVGSDGNVMIHQRAQLYSSAISAALTSALSQTVTLPAAMHAPTLSFAYSLSGVGAPDGAQFRVEVDDGITATTVYSTTTGSSWRIGWADMQPWLGKTVTIGFHLLQPAGTPPARLMLDTVSLGPWRTPIVAEVSPRQVSVADPGAITIRGENFIGVPTVKLGDVPLQSVQVIGPGELRATVPADLTPGQYPIWVVNPGGTRQAAGMLQVGDPLYLPMVLR